MIFLGIDPGVTKTGYGLVKEENGKLFVLDFGCIDVQSGLPLCQKLKEIYQQLEKIFKKFQPKAVAVEKIFFYKNVKTAIDVGQARGVILLKAAEAGLPVYELTPLETKQAITGYGRASKRQIQEMVKLLLNLKKIPKPDDAADALALAICCAYLTKNLWFQKK